MMGASWEDLQERAVSSGLALRGGFHPEPRDKVPRFADGGTVGTIVLLGCEGSRQWPVFAASSEFADGCVHALDRWSRRVIEGMGARYGALCWYPSDGPPWQPFQRWARRADSVHASPIGLLIHPEFGLWHAYRGALGLRERLPLPEWRDRPSPCDRCLEKPCLHTCPVAALAPGAYDPVSCAAHAGSSQGSDCLRHSCRARRSCPIGAAHAYGEEQSLFHMAAFLASRR